MGHLQAYCGPWQRVLGSAAVRFASVQCSVSAPFPMLVPGFARPPDRRSVVWGENVLAIVVLMPEASPFWQQARSFRGCLGFQCWAPLRLVLCCVPVPGARVCRLMCQGCQQPCPLAFVRVFGGT